MKSTIKESSKALLKVFAVDDRYDLYQCPHHGFHAHLKTGQYTGCTSCGKIYSILTPEEIQAILNAPN